MRPDVTIFLKRLCQGGVTRVGCILANGFAERGVATEVATALPDGPVRASMSDRVMWTPLRPDRRGSGSGPVATVLALARHLRRARPRVLLSPGNHTHVTAAIAHALAGGGSHLVVKITNPIIKTGHRRWRRFYKKALYGWILSRASSVLVLSPGRVGELAGLFPRAAAKLRFVHNPYITAAMVAAPERCAVERQGAPMILSVGRLAEQKNHVLLLRALARIADTPWRLVVLGEGPLEAELRDLSRRLGIAERVEFMGYVPDPTGWFLSARVLALSSEWEDLPAVALEALACGCPVVTTDCSPALTAILEEVGCGAVVPVGNEAALAGALGGALRRPAIGRVAPAVLRYTVENGVDDHLDAIRPLLARV